ncbi:cytochrome c oxidase subunit VII [Histoplasma capsulatum G186AR]|uniref:Cytochrome c oxidase subunit VII n=1 Tax=Ajellomyces capsulatus TaxID=5037 RepID=A0A8H7YIZ2_AJECA|nr:cytochrome c oxidase subunit VII [Histoplasma capsulatum]QSS72265.1 cytochrome c oxidase subunit VII [Histoplasma capsulatum G186AR]
MCSWYLYLDRTELDMELVLLSFSNNIGDGVALACFPFAPSFASFFSSFLLLIWFNLLFVGCWMFAV